jgi:hypothetical protein
VQAVVDGDDITDEELTARAFGAALRPAVGPDAVVIALPTAASAGQ